MNNKLQWSAIKNQYCKSCESENDLKQSIKYALLKAVQDNSPAELFVVHLQSKTKIQIKQDQSGKYRASIVRD